MLRCTWPSHAGGHPREIISDQHPEQAELAEAKAEVKRAVDEARRIAPKFAGPVALILLDSPCQIHPLIAQSWTGRLRNNIVIAANTGLRQGYVHFAVRSATGQNLITFLRDKAPPGAGSDEAYGNGHEQATGGALNLRIGGICREPRLSSCRDVSMALSLDCSSKPSHVLHCPKRLWASDHADARVSARLRRSRRAAPTTRTAITQAYQCSPTR
jgi:hypothetical protein